MPSSNKAFPWVLISVGSRDLVTERVGPFAAHLLRAGTHTMTIRRADLPLLGTVLAG